MSRKLTVLGCQDPVDPSGKSDCPAHEELGGSKFCGLAAPRYVEREFPQDGTAPDWCPLRGGAFTLELGTAL